MARSRTSTDTSGTYYLAVTVTDGGTELSDTQTIPINVVELAPIISVSSTPITNGYSCDEGIPVPLNASAFGRSLPHRSGGVQLADPRFLGRYGSAEHRSEFQLHFHQPRHVHGLARGHRGRGCSAPATATITVSDSGPRS